ncbi:hypothetical protein HYC85_001033 [Camellia sinensis]|uniref:Uncharacterized protein n=1 Tax=Camellia sinensis TaxID=4442 RepID=A0A7J7I5Z3_CAMSI|nr:hypothetical protein HYC85_001033 [Camellia sinensis]
MIGDDSSTGGEEWCGWEWVEGLMAASGGSPTTNHTRSFSLTKKRWPKWDKRSKLNYLLTCVGSAKLTERIRKEPPLDVQKYVLEQCKKWNLVWVGKNKVALVELNKIEIVMGVSKKPHEGSQ